MADFFIYFPISSDFSWKYLFESHQKWFASLIAVVCLIQLFAVICLIQLIAVVCQLITVDTFQGCCLFDAIMIAVACLIQLIAVVCQVIIVEFWNAILIIFIFKLPQFLFQISKIDILFNIIVYHFIWTWHQRLQYGYYNNK